MKNITNFLAYVFKGISSLIVLKKQLHKVFIISTILLLDSEVINNTFYIQPIGSGIVIFSGLLFPVSSLSKTPVTSFSACFFNFFTNSSIRWFAGRNYSTSRKTNKYLHWSNYLIKLDNTSLLTNILVIKSIKEFWKKQVNLLDDNKHMLILFRVEEDSGIWSTLGQLQKVNKNSLDYFINFVTGILDLKSEAYKEMNISRVAISYGIRDGKIETSKTFEILKPKHFQNYKHYKIPNTMDPLKYGKLIHHDKVNKLFILQIGRVNQAVVKQIKNTNHVEIYREGDVILSYVDQWLNDDRFERTIGKNKYLFIKHEDDFSLSLLKVNKSTKPITRLKPQKPLNKDKIATMDFETYRNNDGKLVPYLVSWYDGSIIKSYFLADYNSPEVMISNCVKDLMKSKYKGFKIYIHNFAKFDSIFLLNTLTELGLCTPIINKGRIISVGLTFKTKDENIKFYSIDFRDSLQLLLMSLKKLAKSFGVEIQKGIFPYSFVTADNLNYVGTVPPFNYFDNITHDEYLNYCNNFKNNWSLRTEAIKYCNTDCISLHQILIKFNKLIFDNFKININKYPTLPSLSFGIYRTLFLKKSYFIAQISGRIRKDLHLSYTGGATDMYIPTNYKNEKVYCYDINSLYPSVMVNYPMPIGKPTYFEGDIRKINPDAFGFFYCKITTPTNLEHPILQTHVKTSSGMRTVSALGQYSDMLFSEEMDNAIKLGYKFEILWGYTFEKGNIFNDFITSLYNMRLQYDKSNPLNYIAKIIMNSLYGRFGMDDQFTISEIVNKEDYINFEKHNIGFINDVIPLGNKFLVNVGLDYSRIEIDTHLHTHNVNIAIASAITSYARIVMSQFKNNPMLKLFYTDTDSIYTNLNPEQMNELFPGIINEKELGKLKLETVSTKTIFISPKCYYLSTEDNQEIFKIKGLNKSGLSTLTVLEFEKLLNRNHQLLQNQEKWFRSISESTITIKDQTYTIQQTSNKRELIYNSDNILVGTKPYIITNDKILLNHSKIN